MEPLSAANVWKNKGEVNVRIKKAKIIAKVLYCILNIGSIN
jgi:hypothetical protein